MSNSRLDAVTRAKQAYVVAKTTLEARLRDEMRKEMANLQTQVDIAVRYAFDSGESKADILRALGTKFYGTLNDSLERTHAVTEIVGANPLDNVYWYMGDDVIGVTYDNHGPNQYSGSARFTAKKLDDGSFLFLSLERLWSDDYKTRNDVVAALDGKTDGFYYEELMSWIRQSG
jgi:hypothetical protein